MGRTVDRGYGYEHKLLKSALMIEMKEAYEEGNPLRCGFCLEPMTPKQDLDLDHTPDRLGYRGLAHASCNRADGARKRNRKRRNSRKW